MESIFSGIAAIAECVAELIALLFKSVFRLGLSAHPDVSQSSRKKNLLAGLLGLGFITAVIVSVGGFFWYLENGRALNQKASHLVESRADELNHDRDDADRYRRAASPLADRDPWRHFLEVEYARTDGGEMLVVRSVGHDGIRQTDDDIVAARHNLQAGDVIKAAGPKLVEAVKKKWNRLHDSDKGEEND